MKKSILFLATLFSLTLTAQTGERKVMVIGIDGTRSDALQQANMPNVDGLISGGLATFDAWHCGITVSAPSWSDVMCGVWEAKHGVTSNSYTNSDYNTYPYFVTRAKEHRPDLYAVQVTEWAPMSDLVYNDGWDEKIKVPDGAGTPTAEAAVTALQNDELDVLFVYFDAVDLAGHASGFSTANPSYMAALEGVDVHVGTVLNALYARPNYANEDWLILVITDHGGIGTGHGGGTQVERKIWWIGKGSTIDLQTISGEDPGSYQYNGIPYFVAPVDPAKLKQTPVQTDIGVTALHHLLYDLDINPEEVPAWNLDGKSWLKKTTSIKQNTTTQPNVVLYPNPTSQFLSIWFENKTNETVNLTITNLEGKVFTAPVTTSNANKITLDIQNLAQGNYIATLTIGKQVISKPFIVSQVAPAGSTIENHDHSKCNGKH